MSSVCGQVCPASSRAGAWKSTPLLQVAELSVSFVQYTTGLHQRALTVITGLDVDVRPGEVLAVVGASGSGKSLLAHAILGILPRNARVGGTMRFAGEDLTPERHAALRGREIALVPQSVTYLDPLMRVGTQVRSGVPDRNGVVMQRAVFSRYHLSEEVERLFPFQLSGGMTRRVLIATAVLAGASLVIADEPTPGLHPEVLDEALRHLRELADDGKAVMLITHDIESALGIADRIAVFYAGTTVEVAPVADFRGDGASLRHPYTRALWHALPGNGFQPVHGSQPPSDELPEGCLFQPRCDRATSECSASRPPAENLRGGMVRCIHAT